MASLRPYGYPGGTLYTSASSSSGKGLAMYYDGWFNECGWAALFYNNTGKDIIITKLWALAGANPSAFTAKFECSDVGTSAPNTISRDSLTDVADVTIPYCGKTVSSWVGADANIKITKGHYFIVGLRSINAGGDHWFNLARTGNNANSCPYNCYFMQKNSSNGATTWTRDWSSIWRYQTPEIMVDYKDAAIQVYFPGSKTSISDSFYMGAVKSYSLTDCNTTTVSCSNGHIGAAISSNKNTLYVWANLLDSTQTATITVYGYNSSATLTVTAYPSKITSCDITASVLKPGQSTNFSYGHEGVSDNSSGTVYGNDTIGQTWRVDYDQIKITNNPNSNIVKINHTDSSNSGTITFNAITSKSNSVSDESVMTIAARVATDYNNGDTYRYPSGLSKSDTVKFKHWLTSDINVSLNQNLLRLSKGNYLTVSNKTNLTNITVPGDFNSVTLSFDNDDPLSEYLAFRKSGEIYKNQVTFSKNESVDIIVENDISSGQTFSDEHILNIKLTNDVVVTTTLKFKTAVVYDFDFIYPKNIIWETPYFSEGPATNKWVEGESIARETIAKLPVYRTGKKEDSQKISVFNYPIQIQMPTLKQGDTANKSNIPDFKLSLYDCSVLLNDGRDTIKINSATLGRYDAAINASGHDDGDNTANERIILVNCDIPVSADNIDKKNLAKVDSCEITPDNPESSILTDIIYDDGPCENLFVSFTADNSFGTGTTVMDSIALVTDSDEILWHMTNSDGFNGSYEMNVKLESDSKLRIKIYNSDGKSVWAAPKISNIVINNLSNDNVPGILLSNSYSMILGLLLTRVNDNGEENVGNNTAVKYNTVHHRLKIDCNVFNECDLSTDRTNQRIQYKNQTIIDEKNSTEYTYNDYTLRRAICDSSRIGYMYGRLTTDETLEEAITDGGPLNGRITYLDNFEAIDSHFINTDKIETDKDYGLPLSDSRLYLDSLLSAMNDLLVNIKNSPKCQSDQSLKNKLKTPRRLVAVGYPIMWDDSNVLNHDAETLSDVYSRNLTLREIFNTDGYSVMNDTLTVKTASPFKELLDCVSSFQDSVPLANVSIIDNEGNICPVSFYFDNNTPNNTADDKIFKLGVIDY